MNIAFVQLYKSRDHYHFDLFNVACATDLRAAGHRCEVVTFTLGAGVDESVELARVREHLDGGGVELVIVDRVWARRVVQALAAPGRRIGCLFAPATLDWPEVDFVLSLPRRAAVREIVDALARGTALGGVPDVRTRAAFGRSARSMAAGLPEVPSCAEDAAVETGPSRRHSMREELTDLRLDYSTGVDLTPERPPVEIRKHLVGNWGCAYRMAPNRTGLFDDLLLPAGVTATGCTFCDRPGYELMPMDSVVAALMAQLEQLWAQFTRIDKIVVIDEFALRYVDRFARAASASGRGGCYLWSGRPDHITRWGSRLERAAELDRSLHHVIYCLGIENFSDAELQRMNKGLTARDLFAALEALDRLASRHPNLAVEDSFGFILFTPWTTVDDLRANVAAFRRVGFERFRAAATGTFLRLYPQTALYHRAAADGLLLDPASADGHASAHGYGADTPWRFADTRVADIARELGRMRGGERLRRLEALVAAR